VHIIFWDVLVYLVEVPRVSGVFRMGYKSFYFILDGCSDIWCSLLCDRVDEGAITKAIWGTDHFLSLRLHRLVRDQGSVLFSSPRSHSKVRDRETLNFTSSRLHSLLSRLRRALLWAA